MKRILFIHGVFLRTEKEIRSGERLDRLPDLAHIKGFARHWIGGGSQKIPSGNTGYVSSYENHEALNEIIFGWTGECDHYQAMYLLQVDGVPAGTVLKGSETIYDPHLEARRFSNVVDNPEAGSYMQTTLPWMLSKSPRQTTVTAAGLGEHNYQVFNGLSGLSASEIYAPLEQGITGDRPNPDA